MAFLQIISDNILPLLVFVAIGYFLDRAADAPDAKGAP